MIKCVYVCVHVHMCVCVCVLVHMCAYVTCLSVCMCVCLCVCVHVCVCVYMCEHMQTVELDNSNSVLQGPLYLDLLGTCHEETMKPAVLLCKHIKRYHTHVARGFSFYPPEVGKVT